MPSRKRKVIYPPARTSKRPGPPPGVVGDPTHVRPTVVSIDVTATTGRSGLRVGDRVRIGGSGQGAGEVATIERLVGGVIPAASVRTDAGRTRRVRTIDLEPISDGG